MSISATATPIAIGSEGTRWVSLIFCIVCMVMIANLQYGWTLFVNPINKANGWSIASIQVAFAVFIALETWLTPIEVLERRDRTRRTGEPILTAPSASKPGRAPCVYLKPKSARSGGEVRPGSRVNL